MQLISGTWKGALISADGRQETEFSLSQPQPGAQGMHIQQAFGVPPFMPIPAMTIDGGAPTRMRLLEGARNALVALADAVPDPASGSLAQVLLDVRVLGDRLVGNWLRRDANGVMLSGGTLVAKRAVAECARSAA